MLQGMGMTRQPTWWEKFRDFAFGAGPLKKAAGTGPQATTPPAQNTDYVKAAAEEQVRRMKEREMQKLSAEAAKILTTPKKKLAVKK